MENNLSIQTIINQWKSAQLPEELQKELDSLDDAQLDDAFYQSMSFGTAGMRGVMGVGVNRMNIFTIRQTTQALANHIVNENKQEQGVVIGYDSRLHSSEFAHEAAMVLRANKIKVWQFGEPRPTPQLSFAVRELGTYAGIMITASHNPKQYNGYKLYGSDGGQLPPIPVNEIIDERKLITDLFHIDVLDEGIEMLDEKMDQAYLAKVHEVTINQEVIDSQKDKLKITFTPLHGAGGKIALQALKNIGLDNVTIVEEQFEPDGNFPTVTSPNPENGDVFELAKKTENDLLLAIDPDSDRLGAALRRNDGSYQLLTGNQIAAVITFYILKAKQDAKELPTNGVIVTSNVSSTLPQTIAASFGIDTIYVPTGFKYIAEKIQQYEDDHSHTFLFGFEESFGYLVQPFVRDKDAVQATVIFSEIAAYFSAQGKTVADGLDELFEQFGYFFEKTNSIDFPGANGADKMEKLMQRLYLEKPSQFDGIDVQNIYQYNQQKVFNLKKDSEEVIDFPKINVVRYELTDGSWIAVRPSGTEPKLKVYIGVSDENEEDALKKRDGLNEAVLKFVEE